MSRAKYYTCEGYTLTMHEWSLRTGLDTQVIKMRLHSGWDLKKALNTPNQNRKFELDGKRYTLAELAERSNGLTKGIIGWRIRNGMSVKEAITMPRQKKRRPLSLCEVDCFHCPYDDCIKGY